MRGGVRRRRTSVVWLVTGKLAEGSEGVKVMVATDRSHWEARRAFKKRQLVLHEICERSIIYGFAQSIVTRVMFDHCILSFRSPSCCLAPANNNHPCHQLSPKGPTLTTPLSNWSPIGAQQSHPVDPHHRRVFKVLYSWQTDKTSFRPARIHSLRRAVPTGGNVFLVYHSNQANSFLSDEQQFFQPQQVANDVIERLLRSSGAN
jgi:hypothetical protein